MKLGPVPKLDKRHKTTSKKLDDDVISTNCDAIVIFLIYGQFDLYGYKTIVLQSQNPSDVMINSVK